LAAFALTQLIYDVPDTTSGCYSAMRGHSLARDMYGYNYTWNPTAQQQPNPPLNNIIPFNGTGRLHVPSVLGLPDDAMVPSYVYYSGDGFCRDPERYGVRNIPAGQTANTVQPQLYTGGQNSSYTYPDHNHMFLGAMKADGTLLAQSFYRPWIFDPTGLGLNNTSNPNWTNAAGKYLILRPRPQDMDPSFPYPADAGGDVKNVTGAPGGNDSIWMDLDFPFQVTSTGQKFKPLFAFYVQDLDNRVNINAHGNVRGLGNGGSPHVSNQGLGPWDVNLGLVLNQNGNEWSNLFLGNGNPMQPLYGRYGPDLQPNQPPGPWGKVSQPGNLAHDYAQIDVDSCNELANNAPTGPIALPGAIPQAFPSFPQGYSNGNNTERTNHPMVFNVVNPAVVQMKPTPIYDRTFGTNNMFQLLYVGQTGSQALSSEPGGLCPTNFANNPIGSRIANLVTTDSWDVDRPAVTPWLYDRTASNYAVATTSPADQLPPTGPPVSFPDPAANRNNAVPANSDFGIPGQPAANGDWRTNNDSFILSPSGRITQYLSRVDLNRFLTPYPHMGSSQSPGQPVSQLNYISKPAAGFNGRFDVDKASNGPIYSQFMQAQADRQQLADDIYRRLLRVTGVPAPAIPAAPTDAELMPRRWLAQLAVNIVDFIDEDDISTPFNFYTALDIGPAVSATSVFLITKPNPELLKYWVFGTELPRVVLNEVLTEYTLPTDNMGNVIAGNVNVNFWAELYNPLPTSAPQPLQQLDIQGVPLSVAAGASTTAYCPFQITITDSILPRPAGYNDNILGSPNNVRNLPGSNDFPGPAVTVDGTNKNVPMTLGPQSFFLIGPKADDVGNTISPPGPKVTVPPPTTPLYQNSTVMQYTLAYDPAGPTFTFNGTPVMDTTNGVTILLRRLCNPYLPYDPNLNPYMTIDYLDTVKLNQVKSDGSIAHSSVGRRQPYASALSQIAPQQGGNSNTQHTFGQLNNSSGTPPNLNSYDWLVHLDRQVLSPMELLNVSGFHPWQLTHQFRADTGNGPNPNYGHLVNWTDQTNRLYRIFEFLEAHDRAAGMTVGGRLAGKININTVWDPETFNALCDPQPSNHFTATDVNQVYQNMITLRTPNLGGNPPGLSAKDQPFLSMATGYSTGGGDPLNPSGSGINNTFMRAAPTGGLLFQAPSQLQSAKPPAWHPYFQNELMTKIYNNCTTRSNVFAVWLTVGFFNVVQDTDAMGNPVRPVKLGSELGAQCRRRMFAIIDRTNLDIASPAPYLTTTKTPVMPAQPIGSGPSFPVTVTIRPQAMSGTTANGMSWSIQPGTTLVVDTAFVPQNVFPVPPTNAETVIVTSVQGNTFTATFTRPHGTPPPKVATSWSITIPGNPGPQPGFSPGGGQPVVPSIAFIS
jgi:hypothetical protein